MEGAFGSPENSGPESFRAFYDEAEARDDAMSSLLLEAMSRRKIDRAVLVAGGFHSPGLSRRLTEVGAAVVTFVPKITAIDSGNGASSLSVFTQEKPPLEKLFEGKKLYLASSLLSGFARSFAAVHIVGPIALAGQGAF